MHKTLCFSLFALALITPPDPALARAEEAATRGELRDVLEDAGEARAEIMKGLTRLGPDGADWTIPLVLQMKHRYFLTVERGSFVKHHDHRNMTADIIVDTVRLARQARETYPWARDLPERDFITFALPYRHTTEKLTNWRRFFWERKDLHDQVAPFAQAYEQANTAEGKSEIFRGLLHHLNSAYLTSHVSYAPRGMPALAPEELFEQKKGRCTDLTCAIVALYRTVGIAATGVRAIWWPDGDGNHCWAGVLDPCTGEWYDIDSGLKGKCDAAYFRRFRWRRAFAKVYRITPGQEQGRLAALAAARESEATDPYVDMYLVGRPMIDVTPQYGPVVSVPLETSLPRDGLAYASVFNHGTWLPVAVARASEGGAVLFPDLGAKDVLYFAAPVGSQGRPVPFFQGGLFVARPDGTVLYPPILKENGPRVDVEIPAKGLKGVTRVRLRVCEHGRWKPLESLAVEDGVVEASLQPDTIYLLQAEPYTPRGKRSRPFRVDSEGKVIWH